MKSFVVPSRAEIEPDIARRLRERGHETAIGALPVRVDVPGDEGPLPIVVVDVRDGAVERLRAVADRADRERFVLLAVARAADIDAVIACGSDDFLRADASDASWSARLALAERHATDAAAHRRADVALAESHANLEALIENVRDYVLFADETGAPIYYNSAYKEEIERLVDFELRPGVKPHEHLPDPALRAVWDEFHRRVLSGERFTQQYPHAQPDGTVRHFEISYNPVIKDGRIIGFSEFTREITAQVEAAEALREARDDLERKVAERTADLERSYRVLAEQIATRRAAEDARRESEELYLRVFERAPVAIVVWDRDCRVVGWNPHAERTFGWSDEEILGHDFFDFLIPPSARDGVAGIVEQMLAGDLSGHSVNANLTKSGREIVCEWESAVLFDRDGRVWGAISIGVDVTEKRELEQQLRRSEKLESIGQLAGGIAHDLNNQLVGIKGFAELLAERTAADPQLSAWSGGIRRAAGRAADLVENLLAFARKRSLADELVDLHELVDEVVSLLERSIDKRIEIVRDLGATRPIVRGDPTQLHGALLNLALNARDAMPDGGTLRFTTRRVALPQSPTASSEFPEPDDVADGPYVRLAVHDSGTGMDPAVRERVFEPFFTTKERGTGMGLAAVYGTVHSHGGSIEVHSEPGRGSEFEIRLPLVEGSPTMTTTSPPAATEPAGGAAVLVIDDEETVRELFTAMLARLGHRVTTCADGDEGIAVFGVRPGAFDLVIVDVTMPRRSGLEVLAALRAIAPDVRAVLTSGYAEDAVALPDDGTVRAFLAKPFDMETLAERVAAALAD